MPSLQTRPQQRGYRLRYWCGFHRHYWLRIHIDDDPMFDVLHKLWFDGTCTWQRRGNRNTAKIQEFCRSHDMRHLKSLVQRLWKNSSAVWSMSKRSQSYSQEGRRFYKEINSRHPSGWWVSGIGGAVKSKSRFTPLCCVMRTFSLSFCRPDRRFSISRLLSEYHQNRARSRAAPRVGGRTHVIRYPYWLNGEMFASVP